LRIYSVGQSRLVVEGSLYYYDYLALWQEMARLGWQKGEGAVWWKDVSSLEELEKELERVEKVLLELGFDYRVEVIGHTSAGDEWV